MEISNELADAFAEGGRSHRARILAIVDEMIEQRRQRLEPVTAMPQIDVLRELQARIDWENQRMRRRDDRTKELCELLALFHEHGSEASAVASMTERQKLVYHWAIIDKEGSDE